MRIEYVTSTRTEMKAGSLLSTSYRRLELKKIKMTETELAFVPIDCTRNGAARINSIYRKMIIDFVSGMICFPVNQVNILNNK